MMKWVIFWKRLLLRKRATYLVVLLEVLLLFGSLHPTFYMPVSIVSVSFNHGTFVLQLHMLFSYKYIKIFTRVNNKYIYKSWIFKLLLESAYGWYKETDRLTESFALDMFVFCIHMSYPMPMIWV